MVSESKLNFEGEGLQFFGNLYYLPEISEFGHKNMAFLNMPNQRTLWPN